MWNSLVLETIFFALGNYLSPSPQSSKDILILAAQDLQHPSLSRKFPSDPKVFIRYYGCGCFKKQSMSSACCRPFLPRALFPGILIQKHSGSFIFLLLMTQNQTVLGRGRSSAPSQSQWDSRQDWQVKTSKHEWKSSGKGGYNAGLQNSSQEKSLSPCSVGTAVSWLATPPRSP